MSFRSELTFSVRSSFQRLIGSIKQHSPVLFNLFVLQVFTSDRLVTSVSVRGIDGAVDDWIGFRIDRKRHEKLIAHCQPLIIGLQRSQFAILRRF